MSIAAHLLHAELQPFRAPLLQKLQHGSLMMIWVTLVGGVIIQTSSIDNSSFEGKVLGAMLAIMNVAMVVVTVLVGVGLALHTSRLVLEKVKERKRGNGVSREAAEGLGEENNFGSDLSSSEDPSELSSLSEDDSEEAIDDDDVVLEQDGRGGLVVPVSGVLVNRKPDLSMDMILPHLPITPRARGSPQGSSHATQLASPASSSSTAPSATVPFDPDASAHSSDDEKAPEERSLSSLSTPAPATGRDGPRREAPGRVNKFQWPPAPLRVHARDDGRSASAASAIVPPYTCSSLSADDKPKRRRGDPPPRRMPRATLKVRSAAPSPHASTPRSPRGPVTTPTTPGGFFGGMVRLLGIQPPTPSLATSPRGSAATSPRGATTPRHSPREQSPPPDDSNTVMTMRL